MHHHSHHNNNSSSAPSSASTKGKRITPHVSSVIPKKFCDFVFRRNVDNRVYRSESFRFIQKTDSFIAAGAARRSLKVPVIENYIDPVDHQEGSGDVVGGKEEPSYHEIQERYNAPYYYSDTIKEAPEPPYCSPCPQRKSSYKFSRRGNSRGQIVRRKEPSSESISKRSNSNSNISNNNKEEYSSHFPSKWSSQYRRSSPHPLDVDGLIEPLKSTSLQDPPPTTPTNDQVITYTPPGPRRNHFVSVCQILNSPNGTITNVPKSSIPGMEPPTTPPPIVVPVRDHHHHHHHHPHTNVWSKPEPQPLQELPHEKSTDNSVVLAIPITHKYLKASVVRGKRLQLLKSSRSVNSLDSVDYFRAPNNDDRRSLCGFDHHHHSTSTGSSSNSGSSSRTSNHNHVSALSILDNHSSSGCYSSPSHCDSPECNQQDVYLPKLQAVVDPEEFRMSLNSSPWVDDTSMLRSTGSSSGSGGGNHYGGKREILPRNLEPLEFLIDDNRIQSRKSQLSRLSCDNSSVYTGTSGGSVLSVPIPDHYYSQIQATGRDTSLELSRLHDICYNQNGSAGSINNIPKRMNLVPHGNFNNGYEQGYTKNWKELTACSSLPPCIPQQMNEEEEEEDPGLSTNKSASSNESNYVKPPRFWGNAKFSVSPYQFKVSLPLESQEWFHGVITRVESEKILAATKAGSFLVRNCENSSMNHFSLSIKCSRGFIHIRIEPNSRGTYVLAEQEFASIPYLINHFMVNRLPIKGAEHVKLLYPVITQFL